MLRTLKIFSLLFHTQRVFPEKIIMNIAKIYIKMFIDRKSVV